MNQENFAERRASLMREMGDGAIAVVFSAPKAIRNQDAHYTYRTDSYFYYLTGLLEPDSALILAPGSDNPFQLYVRTRDPLKELWEGKILGVEGAKQQCGADASFAIEKFQEQFRAQVRTSRVLYYSVGYNPEADNLVMPELRNYRPDHRKGEQLVEKVINPQLHIGKLRKVKSRAEADCMRLNCQNSSQAHIQAMRATKVGMYEYEVQAVIEAEFRRRGAQDLAYGSIVAGGANATCLHYTNNRDQLQDGDLLLIDAGGERDLYASDITITYPVNGKFTEAQAEIYNLVLKAQVAAKELVKPGVAFYDIHDKATEVLVEGMLSLGILKGDAKSIIEKGSHRTYYPHGTGHWLGLDVHDVGPYRDSAGKSLLLEPGNVFTIEPGLYFQSDCKDVAEKYRGIGVRIEDDILVTDTAYENLTKDCPREIAEIEALVGSGV